MYFTTLVSVYMYVCVFTCVCAVVQKVDQRSRSCEERTGQASGDKRTGGQDEEGVGCPGAGAEEEVGGHQRDNGTAGR